MPSRTAKDRPKGRGVAPHSLLLPPNGMTASAPSPFSPGDGAQEVGMRARSLCCRNGCQDLLQTGSSGHGVADKRARRLEPAGAYHMWPDMSLCGLTGVQSEHGGRVTDAARKAFRKG